MKVSHAALDVLARAITEAVHQGEGLATLVKSKEEIRNRIVSVILRNFDDEDDLEREAERLADTHARDIVGMDRRKIVQGIKTRLAKERDFPL